MIKLLNDYPSHPSWVCGLKLVYGRMFDLNLLVTPFVGVWIETAKECYIYCKLSVTPFVGVWIETAQSPLFNTPSIVTPFVGVWIETNIAVKDKFGDESHTLRGCVD